MVKLNSKKILKASKKDFEKTWVETADLLPRNTKIDIKKKGSLHPMREVAQKCRIALYDMGFQEYENRTILPDSDVYKQYGPETPIILDRAFYLAKIPRPEIGISSERVSQVKSIIGDFNKDILQNILRSYKKGEIEGDDLIEEIVKNLEIKTEKATEMITKVFPEFEKLSPQSTNMTLRSHMTATWYHTLSALQEKENMPVTLFAIGPRYRNEQREDKGHLRVHHSTSLVVMDPEMSIEAGRKITLEFLLKFGFTDARFEKKKATSKYYAKDQEEEVFAKLNGEWLEIGDIGMYSPISLANFGIRYPVFNAGFGVERLTMILNNHSDIRELMFPQFYERHFDDSDISDSLSLINVPKTERGSQIARRLKEESLNKARYISPCSFVAYEDDEIIVSLVEREIGKRLLGPAANNEVYVEDGNILSRPIQGSIKGLPYMESVSAYMAHMIEKDLEAGKFSGSYQIKMPKSLASINLQIPPEVHNYITGNHKKINIGGPIFLTVQYEKK